MTPYLTHGLRLALDQLEAMVRSYDSRHPMPNWRQQRVWQDARRELWQAGFSTEPVWPVLEIYDREREAARSARELLTAATTRRSE